MSSFGSKRPPQGYSNRSEDGYSCIDSEGNLIFTPVMMQSTSPLPPDFDPIENEPTTNPKALPIIEPTTFQPKECSEINIENANFASSGARIEPAPSFAQLVLHCWFEGKTSDIQRTVKPIDDIISRRLERIATARLYKSQFKGSIRAKYFTFCRRNINGNQIFSIYKGMSTRKL